MLILVSNDDGCDAPGIKALTAALQPLGEVWSVAPAREMSAQSHAITMHRPLRVRELGERRYSVDGTPVDCVYLAMHHLLPRPPALVISGINRGANLGDDVHYSGTVAAAREGALKGAPAVAVSLDASRPSSYETAANWAARIAAQALKGMKPGTLWNLNIPDSDHVAGLKVGRLGHRHYDPLVDMRSDPRGGAYAWIGGPPRLTQDQPGTDVAIVAAGFASLTALAIDVTDSSVEDLDGRFN